MGSTLYGNHLKLLQEATQEHSGLYIGLRLTYEHIHLTSFSKIESKLEQHNVTAYVIHTCVN